MNNEEKLKEAKMLYQTANFDQRYVLESLFPELKESEDEKIRETLIRFHRGTNNIDGINGEKIVAWLEKQGEQKLIEWSKDDKNKLLIIEQILDCANLLISSQELTEIKNWLKSLKQRIKGE